MRDAVIVEAVRTPVGKRNGVLSGVHPVDLSAGVLRAVAEMVAERWGLSRTQLDEFSLASHEKAAAAQDQGRFAGQRRRRGPADDHQ